MLLDEEDEFQIMSKQDALSIRNSKIARVAKTLGHLHKSGGLTPTGGR